MNYFIVFAHPERQSLNSFLLNQSVRALKAAGHTVKVSDLYQMKWKAVTDADDFLEVDGTKQLHLKVHSKTKEELAVHGYTEPEKVEGLKYTDKVS